IHTVGPVWQGGNSNEGELLADCYLNSLILAEENGLKTVAFPAISTGVFGFPVDSCAEIMLATTRKYLSGNTGIKKVVFALFDSNSFEAFKKKMENLMTD
ncbi:MAG: macro domain-containing protein, partial [Nitrospinae bacterium]|nr:macro domain-containing protein [Nitrospinota bacterium]